jgi:hypothetical protein
MTAFSDRVYDYFLGQGYSPYGSAALAGNAQHESGGNTRILGDSGTSQGIFQWHNGPDVQRRAALQKYAQDNNLDVNDELTQLQFANHELSNVYPDIGSKLKNAPDLKTAADQAMHFLRPAGYTPDNPGGGLAYAQRYNNAAPYVGADPMPIPINGPGPGGAGVVAPTPGPTDPRDVFTAPSAPADVLGTQADYLKGGLLAKQKTDAIASAAGAASKLGAGLLGAATTPPPSRGVTPSPVHAPGGQGGQGLGNPDFLQILAQQRLGRM